MTTHSAIRLGACCMTLAAGLLSAPPPAHAGSEKTIYAFKGGLDGNDPGGVLTKLGDRLYGITSGGGTSGYGTIFYAKPDGTHQVIHSFAKGTSYARGLVYLGGLFYGAIETDDSDPYGLIFSISPGGAFAVVYRFTGGNDGKYPSGALVSLGGNLYGVTFSGEVASDGNVFVVSPQGVESIVHNFGNDPSPAGLYPNELTTDGTTLFGSTYYGGSGKCYKSYGCGSIYSLTPTGTFTEIFSSFRDFARGGGPIGRLLKLGNELYGVSSIHRGYKDFSTVFKVSLAGDLHILHSFNNGDVPRTALIKFGRSFYGVTDYEIYSITDGVFSSLYSFTSGEGFGSSELTPVKGYLYGEIATYVYPGPYGTIYSYKP